MRRLMAGLLLVSILSASGCGTVVFSAFSGGTVRSSIGTVSIVRLTVTSDGTAVTFVTLLADARANDFFFCGNVVNKFPMNSTVRVNFTPGTHCNSNVVVIVIF